MRFLTPIAKRLTAALSIALILGSVVVSGHAVAAHVSGLSNGVAAPCHHALENADQATGGAGTLDLCRQLCLNKIPDTAISVAAVQPQEPSASIVATATPANNAAISQRLVRIVAEPTPPLLLRRLSPPTFQRLQI